ncbi:MAG: hypothetical protein IJ681_06550 [Bacteroidales bacterium]|nr:hypothetical protein [Bacteroidales bacterium]
MKKLSFAVIAALVFAFVFVACEDNDDYSHSAIYEYGNRNLNSGKMSVIVLSDGSKAWKTNKFETCYVKIPSANNPEWFDIVATESQMLHKRGQTADNRYLFIHADNPENASFPYNRGITIESGIKVIYYEGKSVEDGHASYRHYMTDPKGKLIIYANDGKYMQGEFHGTLYDVYEKATHSVNIRFSRIPVSLVK